MQIKEIIAECIYVKQERGQWRHIQ